MTQPSLLMRLRFTLFAVITYPAFFLLDVVRVFLSAWPAPQTHPHDVGVG